MRLLLPLLLLLAAPAAAQTRPARDTLVHERFQTNVLGWPVGTTDSRSTELTPAAGYHVRYTGSEANGSTTISRVLPLNDQEDYSLELTLRLRGRGGLLWGYRQGNEGSPPSNYHELSLELDRPTPQVRLWQNVAGKWTTLATRDLPAGFDASAAHRLGVTRRGQLVYHYLDGQPVGPPQPVQAWPGPDHDVGLIIDNAGSELWAQSLLVLHHSLIRLAPGVPTKLRRERLPDGINTPGEELRSRVSADGRWLYFVRSTGNPAVVAESNCDIFVAERDATGRWSTPQNLGRPVNTPGNDTFAYLSPDGQSLVLKGEYSPNGQRSRAGLSTATRRPDGTWNMPVPLGVPAPETGDYLDQFLDASGRVLLVAADKPNNPNMDMYVSLRQPDGSWSSFMPLTALNTGLSESSPFLAADGKTLYFASAGHPGYGNDDIFVSRRLDDTWTKWSEPLNLGRGVNTPLYDNHFSIAADGAYAYLTSTEPDHSPDNTDFYCLTLPPVLRPEATRLIKGRILDARTGRLVPGAQVRYEQLPDGKEAGQVAAAAGTFEIALPVGRQYGFRAEAEGYVAASDNLDLSAASTGGEVGRDLYLLPVLADVGRLEALQIAPPRPMAATDTTLYSSLRLKPTAPVPAATAAPAGMLASLQLDAPSAASAREEAHLVLNNVFFEQGKPVLLPASFPELKRLAQTLRDNPALRIRLEGHTDNQGEAAKNQVLSEQRVAEIKKYLIRQQVAADRLETVGYGPTRPVAPNDTESSRRRNRRVEFVILQR